MANTVLHDISFSFDQPDLVLNAFLKLLQQRLRQPLATKTSREMVVRNALTVLIIDAHQERAQYVGGLLTAVGYRPVIVGNELDAFTIFLRGGCLPLAVVLGKDDGASRLFINRLAQQLIQRYDWEPLMIRLQDAHPASFGADTFSPPASSLRKPLPAPAPAPHTTRQLSGKLTPQKETGNHSWSMESGSHAPSTAPFNSSSLSESPSGSFPRNSITRAPSSQVDFPTPSRVQPNPVKSPSGANFPVGQVQFTDPPIQRESKSGPVVENTEALKKEKIYLDGQSLGRYQIRARLGSSIYSEVYRTYDRLREQESALKAIQVDMMPFYVMKDSVEEVTVFQQESELLGPLQHPHILPVLNCGKSYISGTNFIYKNMPFCADGSLANWIRRHGGPGSFTLKDLMPIILQLADALQFAHNYQVTYQNFKLSNILVLNQAKRIQKLEVALADFSVVQDGSYFSKLADGFPYMAPERWDGAVYPASDQYGLAAIVYELLTGRPPYQGSSEHVMRILHTTKSPQAASSLNAKIPAAVDGVLSAAMAKKPGERFGSVALFAQTLQRC
ncbi:serine/threonine protein kinase [Dictyobacter vulcani]|nr:serine/threonine-protein kinase [Dictyobacter vulcani]